uniref:glutamate synthase (ferredoxin) n=1 Tax=Vertebrata lanosa TaxID=1261582 RepID=A0A0B5W2V3_9FLOR|nr:ferredoxin-dependent glutamate synthase [Vertebrata lanosa]AJH66009.1 ferredoxin-dependent glutamate synthase [Vertebrata lanosa]
MQVSKKSTNKLGCFLGFPYAINERDACGVGFVAQINHAPSRKIVSSALKSLECMEHRGGCSSDGQSGDGSGITTQIPWDLLMSSSDYLSQYSKNKLAVAMVFVSPKYVEDIKIVFEWILGQYNFKIMKWRIVPTNSKVLGIKSLSTEPSVVQCLISCNNFNKPKLDSVLFVIRKKVEKVLSNSSPEIYKDFYICSFSSSIITYKGMVRAETLSQYYLDLQDEQYISNFALYHRRFSTNTMPKWSLAQPMRCVAHNGEINTLLGNLNWTKSREPLFKEGLWRNYAEELVPITNLFNSDSANLDAVVELLIHSGKDPEEALMILIPEAHNNQPLLACSPEVRDFYDFYSNLQEPWDGPALVVFTDGEKVGATLDRNGLRPARYFITSDGLINLSSEAGILSNDFGNILHKGRLGPGQMISVDLINNLVLENLVIKKAIANKLPYGSWLSNQRKNIDYQPYELGSISSNLNSISRLHTAYGYSNEDVELVIEHMASSAKEPTFCMGDDIPLAVLSTKPHLIYDYFKQRFAQVTNPAIDPLRESLVMSLITHIGPKGNYLDPNENMARSITINSPIINEQELLLISEDIFKVTYVNTFFELNSSIFSFDSQIKIICKNCFMEVNNGVSLIILTDRTECLDQNYIFIPPLLIVGSVHHYLISKGLRHKVTLIVETGQCWNTHHFACLIGYGASAVCPYLAFLTVRHWWKNSKTQKLMANGKLPNITIQDSQNNYREAIEKGLLKILSKIGICLISSYHGAQIFEILGLGNDIVDLCFLNTTSRLGGINSKDLFQQTLLTYKTAFVTELPKKLVNLGYVQYRPGAEYHVNNPEMSKTLHKAVRNSDSSLYTKYRTLLQDRDPANLRDLLLISSGREPISIENVESIEDILSTFCTGGMSLGALSRETHETLAIAMNRIGGKSNSGEGGEDPVRFKEIIDVNDSGVSKIFPHIKGLKNNDIASSAIKQIASGRFGVTPEYLVNAKQLEIKIAQGAKPGEGGQLPGKKVSPYIATLRNCKPGVTLISPPPHHDIYSIEDLAQLIFDLHQINPDAKISVKLVASVGIGTIAAGVAKGNADVIQISGHDGGTGASPLSSIKHAGIPWELGLTEVHQTLVENELRNRVLLRVDGGLRTGKDIILAAIMGAEEFGFGTIAMIATGCVMARICHTNNCPVGVATQRQDLRNRYPGIPGDLVNFFTYMAEEVRFILADLGYESLKNIVGLTSLLKFNNTAVLKTNNLDLGIILNYQDSNKILKFDNFTHSNGNVLDDDILSDHKFLNAINSELNFTKNIQVSNIDRSIGARISGFIAKEYSERSFRGSLQINFLGTAGQSFGAFICNGMYLSLVGEANDYVGKGMNGGEVVISPYLEYKNESSNFAIIGNTCLYGATGGYLFVNGQAGERFAVRNSAASAVIEGVGDHACEYMTGGLVVVLGLAGRNIAAGMTGGLAYFLDEGNDFMSRVNSEIVEVKKVLTKEAEEQLLHLIELYEIKTKSLKARKILDQWDYYINYFWQIVPPSEKNTPFTDIELSSYASIVK